MALRRRTASPSAQDPNAKILAAVMRIPRGTVMGYGEVAAAAGLRGRARMVARALKLAPERMNVPWHRVLRSDGRIAFPEGSTGFVEQAKRLKREGVAVVNGRVRRAARDLDSEMWGPR